MKSLITSLLLASTLIAGAQTPISSLPAATVANSGDTTVLVQSGVTKQLTVANLVNATTNANATITSNLIASLATITQVTNAIAANALLSANGQGRATNANMYAHDDGTFAAALTLWSFPNNLNGQSLSMYSRGLASFAGAHYENEDTHLAGDMGVWGTGFGPPYTGSFLIDLYCNPEFGNGLTPGPLFKISAGGKSTVVPDSGYVDHPFIFMNPTNGTTDLMLWRVDDRIGKSGFHFDPVMGIQEFIATSTNVFTGTGTITVPNSHTVTGVGTKFLTEATLGSVIFGGSAASTVTAIASDTSLSVLDVITIAGGSSYTLQRPTATFRDQLGNSNAWITAEGKFFSIDRLPFTFKDGGQTWSILHGGTTFYLYNQTANGLPFAIDDNTPNGSFSLDSSGNLNLLANIQPLNILFTTNAQSTLVSMANRYSDVATNANFAWVGLTGLSTSQYQFTTIFLTNTSGGLINFTAPINTHTNGTFNCTNGGVTMIEFRSRASRWTNAVATPLF